VKSRIIHIIGWILFGWAVFYLVSGIFLYSLEVYLWGGIFAAIVAIIGWLMAHDWKFRKKGVKK